MSDQAEPDDRDEALAAVVVALAAAGVAYALAKAGLGSEDRQRVLAAIAEPLRPDAEELLDGDVDDEDFDLPGALGMLGGALEGLGHAGADPDELDDDERREVLGGIADAGAAHLRVAGDALVEKAEPEEPQDGEDDDEPLLVLPLPAVVAFAAAGRRFMGGLYLAATLAQTGLRTFAAADAAGVRRALGEQLEYWDAFEQALRDGSQRPNGQVGNRGRLYGHASWQIGINGGRGRIVRQALAHLERRMLGAAKHCGTCVGEAALGWQPIGTLRPLGDSECGSNCRCYFLYA